MKKGSKVLLEVGTDGVGVITIDNPPLNLVSVDVFLNLKESIEEAVQRDDVKALVIIGSKGKFSAGANVTAFGRKQERKKHTGLGYLSIDFATDTLEAARKPVVAAIDVPSFGGGLEIALACHARISTSTAQLGLPELQYGILPGLGGTQRLPRLVGLHKALEMMLMSKPVNGKDALRLSLVDAIAPADELLGTARRWALDILDRRKQWAVSLYKTDKLEPLAEARVILNLARSQTREQNPNLTHPLVCIDVIEEGIVSGPRTGLWKEAEALQRLRQSDTCKSLVHFFFSQRATLKIPGITDLGLLPRKINKVAIIGGGLMGSGIATVFILSNYHVILKEVDDNLLLAGIGRVKANLQSRVKKGIMTQEKVETVLSLLKGVLNYDSFKDVDLVIEKSSHVAKKIKKTSIEVGNCTGFAVNQMFFPYPQAAMLLTERGADVYHIDQSIKSFGMPMGPFRLVDLVGFRVAIATSTQFIEKFPERSYKSTLTRIMQEDKREGEFTRKGFYVYDDKRKASPDSEIMKYVEKARKASQIIVDSKLTRLSAGEIVEMIFFPVVNEACRILAEGVAVKASDLDIASVMAWGFPAYRGGIIFWANSIGPRYICLRLEDWSKEYGEFFKPCAYLVEHASKGIPLGEQTSHTSPRL